MVLSLMKSFLLKPLRVVLIITYLYIWFPELRFVVVIVLILIVRLRIAGGITNSVIHNSSFRRQIERLVNPMLDAGRVNKFEYQVHLIPN
ncbi:MAG: hypothetical protein EZS28_046384, partial [Streblomastix strix]